MPTVAHAPAAVLPDVQASQSTVIVVALIGAFLLWLLISGRLAAYWALLTGGGAGAGSAAPGAGAGSAAPGSTAPTEGAPSSIPPTTMPGLGLPGASPPANPNSPMAPPASGAPAAPPTTTPIIPSLKFIPGTNIPNPLCILGGSMCQ